MINRTAKKVLLIEENLAEGLLIREMFHQQGPYAFELKVVRTLKDGVKHLAGFAIDVVLIDLSNSQAHEMARMVRSVAPHVSLVLLSSLQDEALAMAAMQDGVQDYLIKDQLHPRELMRALRSSVERKKIQESLFKEQERAQVTLDCIADGVICTDFHGNISFLNPVAERMTGFTLEEAIGKPMGESFKIIDAITRETAPNPMAKAAKLNKVGALPVNCILISRDGHEVFIEDSVAPIHDRFGMVDGSVLVFRDVTVARALAARVARSLNTTFSPACPIACSSTTVLGRPLRRQIVTHACSPCSFSIWMDSSTSMIL